jgi:hypothetical protein
MNTVDNHNIPRLKSIMAQWTDLHNLLHGARYCLDQEFHAHDHVACPEALTNFSTMCDKIHGEGCAESAKAQLLLQGEERHNVLKRDHQDKCSKDGARGMV